MARGSGCQQQICPSPQAIRFAICGDARNGAGSKTKAAKEAHNQQRPRIPSISKSGQGTGGDEAQSGLGSQRVNAVADITYIVLRQEFVYLAVLMDVFTRSICGWNLSRHLDSHLTLTALKRALAEGKPVVHHSDQGVQYAATDYVQTLQAATILVSMASVGCPEENGYAERLMRTIKEVSHLRSM
jgi:transposase InsO family protein